MRVPPDDRRVLPRRAATIVLAAAAFGLVAQYLFARERAGLNVVVATALFLAVAWRLRAFGRDPSVRDAWLPAGALAFAAFCAVRVDAPLVVFDALAALALSIGSVLALRGTRVTGLALRPLVAETCALGLALASRSAGTLAVAAPVLRSLAPPRSSRAAGYAAGLALAIPFLLLFGGLFSSADAVFQRTAKDLFELEPLRELLKDLPARVVLAAAAAWLAGGALASLDDRPEPREVRGAPLLGADVATGMLLAIDALFAFFVALQLAYLFGGRDTLDAAGIAYSAYARRGFFELVSVAGIVGALLFGLDLAVRARGRAYVAAALVLVALTSVVVASAAMRMDLYQRAYGWTELRLYASAAIAYLGLALLILAWAVARGRMAIALQRLAIAGLVVALGVNALGPADVVAGANIARFVDPAPLPEDAYRDIDLGYLISLGDGAIPALVHGLPLLPERERARLDDLLRFVAERRPAPGGWQSWSLDRERAGELLRR
jgi:hypothetical protein